MHFFRNLCNGAIRLVALMAAALLAATIWFVVSYDPEQGRAGAGASPSATVTPSEATTASPTATDTPAASVEAQPPIFFGELATAGWIPGGQDDIVLGEDMILPVDTAVATNLNNGRTVQRDDPAMFEAREALISRASRARACTCCGRGRATTRA